MAEEEIAAASASASADASLQLTEHKRKLDEIAAEGEGEEKTNGSDEAKRAKHDEQSDGLGSENGHDGGKVEHDNDQLEATDKLPDDNKTENEEKGDAEDITSDENAQPGESAKDGPGDGQADNVRAPAEQQDNQKSEQHAADGDETGDAKQPAETSQQPSTEAPQKKEADIVLESSEGTMLKRKMEVPNNKVGVLIGKAGDTIRYLQYNSGAKIQITRDAEADLRSATRPVELVGTFHQIEKAEKLINAVIAEADAGGSPALVARGLATAQTVIASEQIEIQVPDEKVGLLIGKGGETIKGLQTSSGARIQILPVHTPEGNESKHRTVRVTGDRKQVEMASDLIKEVMTQTMRPQPVSSNFNQPMYRPRGSAAGPPHWGGRGPYFGQPPNYDYQQRGPYPPHNAPYPPPAYGNHPSQLAPRSSYSAGWEQRPHQNMQGPRPHTGGYDYYGGPGGHVAEHPARPPVHAPGPAVGMHSNYGHGQPPVADYSQQGAYPQSTQHQSYGQGYNEPRYENQPTQYPYGAQGTSQPVYQQAGTQPGYAQHNPYVKSQPSYNMPSQGAPQTYGTASAGQSGDTSYQAPVQSSQPYASTVAPQQPYPYTSSGPTPQTYPSYGSATSTDMYNQPPPAASTGYPQPAGQPVPSYGQPPAQQAPSQPVPGYGQPPVQQAPAYAQVAPTGGYGSYPASQGYADQSAAAGYAYQGQQDTSYSSGAVATYNAQPSGQPAYAQPTAQPNYDQSVAQAGGYGTVPAVTAGVAKSVSPQPGYSQYDTSQMYAAPR